MVSIGGGRADAHEPAGRIAHGLERVLCALKLLERLAARQVIVVVCGRGAKRACCAERALRQARALAWRRRGWPLVGHAQGLGGLRKVTQLVG